MGILALLPRLLDGSNAPPLPAVSTKLYPPRVRATHVARPRLVSWLGAQHDHRITLVCAPAGYGKSTLVAQWLAQAAIPAAWVTLAEDDGSPRPFFALVVAALCTLDPDLVRLTDARLAHQWGIDADAVVHQLTEELAATTRPFALVLDDYHVVEAAETHRAVGLLLQHAPPAMRVVLIGRAVPPLPLARLEVSGDLARVGPRDLAFTPAEAQGFYREGLGLDLTPAEIGLLHTRTEGWAAGLQLAGIALRGQSRAQAQRFTADVVSSTRLGDQYLWEEVLQRLPDDLRWFLVRTSVLERFTAGLCDAVAGIANGRDLIRRCERDNLFVVPLDDRGVWYRFHHLFADVLRERLTRTFTADELAGLHLRASDWFERNGLVQDAVRHAIAGHAWDRAVGFLEPRCAEFFRRDHLPTLRDWLHGLPPAIFERSPRLAFYLAWAIGRMGRWAEGAQALRFAEAAWTEPDDRLGRGLIALWRAASLHWFDNEGAIRHGQQALELLPEDLTTERFFALSGLGIGSTNQGEALRAERAFADLRALAATADQPWFRLYEMAHSAAVLIQRGHLREAAVLCRWVIQAVGDSPIEHWVQAALLRLGGIHLEWGQLDEAHEHLGRADELAEMTGGIHWRGRIRVGLARVAWARGESDEASDLLEHALGSAAQLGNAQEARNVRAWQARFWLASGHLALARRWADSCDLDPTTPPEYAREVEHLTHVRLLLREGRPDRALRILEPIRDQAAAAGRDGDLVEIAILTALAQKGSGNSAGALRSLDRALELGEPGGYFRVFVDEGEDLAPLLRHAAGRGAYRDDAKRLLAEIDGINPPEQTEIPGTPEALSEREVEVLRLVVSGSSNRAIGEHMFISEKTVKKHMNNILSKLGAANRTQAVDRARRLGLL
jgi:LuxR family maltose regulon positive regulatory protein